MLVTLLHRLHAAAARRVMPWLRRAAQRCLDVCDAPASLVLLAAAWATRVVQRQPDRSHGHERRRILVALASSSNAGDQQLVELVRQLCADGDDVDLLLCEAPGEQGTARPSGGSPIVERLGRGVQPVSLRAWPRLAASIIELRDVCRERQYDVVHAWDREAATVAIAAAGLAGVPAAIVSVRSAATAANATAADWHCRIAAALALRIADARTVNASTLAIAAAQHAWMTPAAFELVLDGLEPDQYVADRRDAWRRLGTATGAPGHAVFVGTRGPLMPTQDLTTFVRMIAAVRQHRSDVFGVIIGDGSQRAALTPLARQLGVEHRVIFVDSSEDDLRLTIGFDVFVWSATPGEFPSALLEAALLGVPAVAADIPGSADVLAYPDTVFAVGNATAAARRVTEALADRDRTEERTRAIRERAAALFATHRTATAWQALYLRLAGTAAPADAGALRAARAA